MQCHNFRHPPKSHDEWLHVLQQQETLHNVEMQKWQKVLQAAVQLLRQVRSCNVMEHNYLLNCFRQLTSCVGVRTYVCDTDR